MRVGRLFFAVAVSAVAVMALVPQASAASETADRQQYCANKADIYIHDFSIEACTFLIISGPSQTPKELAVIYGHRCTQYLKEKQFDRALQDCDEAVWLDDNYLPAYQTRGLVYELTHRSKRAAADFTQVISQEPSNAGGWQGLCRNELALDQPKPAISACSEALRLQPADAGALVTRALAHLKVGALDDAIADFDGALRAKPAQAVALYGRGVARLNRHDSAAGVDDIAAAKAIEADIADQFADRYHIKPNDGLLTSARAEFE
jgi:tetratricopeptide (TPR) repeat protein